MKTNQLNLLILIFVFSSFKIVSQNVGINTSGAAPADCAMLDIVSSDKGLLVPRVTLTNVTTYLPLTGTAVDGMLVYSTAAPTGGNGTGFYYWSTGSTRWISLVDNLAPGSPWSTNGNAGTTASTSAYGTAANNNFIGTTDNTSFVIVSNNLERGRFLNTGEIVFGSQTTTIPDDFFSAVSNPTLDWAVNGYSSNDGSGVYGQVTAGATIYAGVQGEYEGTANGAGVRGIYIPTGGGTAFTFGNNRNGVQGTSAATGSYKFGVYGVGGISARSGGVMGNDGDVRWGALGYFANSGTDYSVYGFGTAYFTGGAGGRMLGNASNSLLNVDPNNQVGMGIYGGVMGGWMKGLVYGTNFSGQKYGIYVHGNTVTNSNYIQLNESTKSDKRVASYATTSLTNELTSKGKVKLVNGVATVVFDENFTELSDLSTVIITATAMGECNGVFIKEITKKGFVVKELNQGKSNSEISFIATATLKNLKAFEEEDILNKSYETNMEGVMHNEIDENSSAKPIWFDGKDVRFDKIDERIIKDTKLKVVEEGKKVVRPK